MNEEPTKTMNYIKNILPHKIIEVNKDLQDNELVNCEVKNCKTLDGFMSDIFQMQIKLRDKNNQNDKLHQMMVKIMKGDGNFREMTRSSIMCSNEVYIYNTVLPYFKTYLGDSVSTFSADDWCPRVYFADYGSYPQLGDEKETILALENLKPLNYRLGPRIDLDEKHLRMMIKNIASYHAVSYAMKIRKDPNLKTLADGLTPLSFMTSDNQELESYKHLFTIGMQRVFEYLEATPDHQMDSSFVASMKSFKDQYYDKPLVLMERFLKQDEFSVILHGDYNRNNVLFEYPTKDGFEDPLNIKMIDFQEVRYASATIDLSFFMYMNIPPTLRTAVWSSLLEHYHESLISSLMDILKCSKNDESLNPYSYEKFLQHFSKFAFYGTMLGIHFIPWMASSEEECERMGFLFENDMKSPELQDLAQTCGGVEVSERVLGVCKHAFEKGYMKIFD
ncbi:unnamed protein product [Diamesa serratosioi]